MERSTHFCRSIPYSFYLATVWFTWLLLSTCYYYPHGYCVVHLATLVHLLLLSTWLPCGSPGYSCPPVIFVHMATVWFTWLLCGSPGYCQAHGYRGIQQIQSPNEIRQQKEKQVTEFCIDKLSKDMKFPVNNEDMANKIFNIINKENIEDDQKDDQEKIVTGYFSEKNIRSIVAHVMDEDKTGKITQENAERFCEKFCFENDNGDLKKGIKRVLDNLYDSKYDLYSWFYQINEGITNQTKLKDGEFIICLSSLEPSLVSFQMIVKSKEGKKIIWLKINENGVCWVIQNHCEPTIPKMIEYLSTITGFNMKPHIADLSN
jgi:hypothetical protein